MNRSLVPLAALLAAALASSHGFAQTFPNRPIKIVIGFGAAGSTDTIGRYYAQRLSEVLKSPVLIENRASAGQLVAINALKSAAPDGHTLYIGTGSSLSQAPGVRADLPYDPLKDFTLISLVATIPGVLVVSPSLPVRTVRDLVKYSRDNPDKLNYGSSGVGSASHLQTEFMAAVTGMTMTHIPLKADVDIMREMVAGFVHLGIGPLQGVVPFIQSGRVRALVVTSAHRVKALPDVPSLPEADYKELAGIDPYTYYGLVGPIGLPRQIVTILNEATDKVTKMPEAIAHLRERMHAEWAGGGTDAFRKFLEDDIAKWRPLRGKIRMGE